MRQAGINTGKGNIGDLEMQRNPVKYDEATSRRFTKVDVDFNDAENHQGLKKYVVFGYKLYFYTFTRTMTVKF